MQEAGFGLKNSEMSMFLPTLIKHLVVRSMVLELQKIAFCLFFEEVYMTNIDAHKVLYDWMT